MLITESKPTTFTVENNELTISGSYEKVISLENAQISIINNIEIESRDNRSNALNAQKGSFTINVHDKHVKPYLNITNILDKYYIQIINESGEFHIISAKDKTKTNELYDLLIQIN